MILDQNCVARLLRSIGMNVQTQLKGYQIMYGRAITLCVWCEPGVNLENFCRTENIQVTRGVWTKTIRPAGRKDVVVTVSGLDFNTPDTLIQGYIEKFDGKLVSKEVIYGKHGDGPLKGVFNGERKYNVEFSEKARPMGTYHFLDGAKVRIFYRGNSKTCARCHQVAGNCLGGGFAKDCQLNGGHKVDLAEHMRFLWNDIGFSPTSFELPAQAENESDQNEVSNNRNEGDSVISEAATFQRHLSRPQMTGDDIKKVVGIQIRNLPAAMSIEEVVKFLNESVDQDITADRVSIMKTENSLNASVENGLEGTKVMAAANELEFRQSKKKYFGKPLYCRILKNLTPEKPLPPTSNEIKSNSPCKNLNPELANEPVPDKPAEVKEVKPTKVNDPKSIPSVKEKTKAIETKADEKKEKSKTPIQRKLLEFGITNPTANQMKRTHNEVGSPTSPESKKSPKKQKAPATDKPNKK